jgi:hypothetical protein
MVAITQEGNVARRAPGRMAAGKLAVAAVPVLRELLIDSAFLISVS